MEEYQVISKTSAGCRVASLNMQALKTPTVFLHLAAVWYDLSPTSQVQTFMKSATKSYIAW